MVSDRILLIYEVEEDASESVINLLDCDKYVLKKV